VSPAEPGLRPGPRFSASPAGAAAPTAEGTPERMGHALPAGAPVPPGPSPLQSSPEVQTAERHLRLVPKQRRQRRDRRRLLLGGAFAAVVAVPMGLVALHVLIAENQFRIDHLEQQASVEQAQYEKLRLSIAQLEAPSRIVRVAEGQLGMQQPASVTYLPPIRTALGGATSTFAGAGGFPPEGEADWPSVKPYLSGGP
jgi:cell division protein FtsL